MSLLEEFYEPCVVCGEETAFLKDGEPYCARHPL